LSGHRVGWKKALHYLTEHFSGGTKIGKQANQPIILLIDELDLLLTRNQSVIIQSKIINFYFAHRFYTREINK
jgi:origin recognition complex subunit 1